MRIRGLIVMGLIALAIGVNAYAQSGFDGRAGGGIMLGYDSRVCDASIAGAIRYSSATSKAEVCVPSTSDSCPNIGDVCADGSVYAGTSPDGNVPMYTTPADAGLFAWNDENSTGRTTTGQTSNVTGWANTSALIGLDSNSDVAGMQPHRAAQHCADLVAHGQSDWYLPARDELNVLWVNRAAIGGFNLSGSFGTGWNWSSSEDSVSNARGQRFSDGFQGNGAKNSAMRVRCVRKHHPFNWKTWGE